MLELEEQWQWLLIAKLYVKLLLQDRFPQVDLYLLDSLMIREETSLKQQECMVLQQMTAKLLTHRHLWLKPDIQMERASLNSL